MHSRFRNLVAISFFAGLCLAPRLPASDGDRDRDGLTNVVYIHSNNPLLGKNSVLGYTRNPLTGVLTQMPGSPFLTGGTGFLNSTEVLGPDDTDQEMSVTPDHRFLYVVNQGSNTIAGFSILPDGSLKPVPGSPFSSQGIQPVTIGIDGPLLFVANRGDQNPGGTGSAHKPTWASFAILPEGSLIPLPWQQPALVPGSSPTQALIAPGGKLLFNADLFEAPFDNLGLPPFIPAFSSVLHSYKVSPFGQLTAASQTAPPAPIPPFILGLQVHPTRPILYAGLVVASALATYTYDNDGHMTLVGTTAGAPNGGLCWIAISPDSQYLYTSDAITDQVDVYSIAVDPLHPVLAQTVNLAGAKNPVNFNVTATLWDTTPFQLKTSADGQFLYVLNHEVADPTGGSITGNALHILKKGSGGMLTEISSSPMMFSFSEVPILSHPVGLAIF
jgi:DNA-binding beta-propeller fold protein YncE